MGDGKYTCAKCRKDEPLALRYQFLGHDFCARCWRLLMPGIHEALKQFMRS